MKSNKGITLLMLVFYIIILTLAIGVLAGISSFFYTNTEYITDNGRYIAEFNKFNMFFLEEVKNNSNVYSIKSDKITAEDGVEYPYNEVIFEDGTVYTYNGKDLGIYRNKVKICNNVSFCSFAMIEDSGNKKNMINVKMALESSKTFQTDVNYVLKYW